MHLRSISDNLIFDSRPVRAWISSKHWVLQCARFIRSFKSCPMFDTLGPKDMFLQIYAIGKQFLIGFQSVWHNPYTNSVSYSCNLLLHLVESGFLKRTASNPGVARERQPFSFRFEITSPASLQNQTKSDNLQYLHHNPDSKVHRANMGPTWVLSAPDRPHVGPMNLAFKESINKFWRLIFYGLLQCWWVYFQWSIIYLRDGLATDNRLVLSSNSNQCWYRFMRHFGLIISSLFEIIIWWNNNLACYVYMGKLFTGC